MRGKLSLGLLALALAVSCILAYLLIFIWNMVYYAVAIALVLLVIFIWDILGPRIKDRRKFLKESLIVLASCVNYTCALLLTILFDVEIIAFLLIATVLSLFVSIVISNVGRSLAYVCVALILGAAITVVLLVLPPLSYGEMWAVNYALEPAVSSVVRLLLFGLVFSFVGSIIGSLASDAF